MLDKLVSRRASLLSLQTQVGEKGLSFPDDRDRKLLNLVYRANGLYTEDEFAVEFSDDRGKDDDTINRCIKAGCIRQVGNHDTDDFYLVGWWWPYSGPEQAFALRGWTAPDLQNVKQST